MKESKIKNKEEKNKKRLKDMEQEGITLIALIVTIIVLLILTGVSIAMLTGENGILTQAQKAKNETENFRKEEENILNDYENYLSKYANGGYVESKGVNAPVLGENMKLVSYNEETKTWKENNSTSSYDYVAGTETEDNNKSRWANAVVTIHGVESYFVWIPRYAYKITYTNPNNISEGGVIDIKFLKGTSNIATDGTVCKYADDETLNKEIDYIIHPAFTSNVNLGGWDSEVLGIWVGKYEAAKSDAGTTRDEMGDSIKIMIQPGVTSWRKTTIGDMYNYAKGYSTDLNSHLLKNSEWGAIAYLTYSKYRKEWK